MAPPKPIAITTGDHRGIGPEVIAKGLHALRRVFKPDETVVLGIPELYRPFMKLLPKKWHVWTENEVESPGWPGPRRGHLNFVVPYVNHVEAALRGAYCSGRYVELAAKWTLARKFSAVSTGPIDKNDLQRGGYPFDGHTDMLQSLCKSRSVTMMLAGPRMRVALATIHIPLREVADRLTVEGLLCCIENTVFALMRDFGIKRPRIAVLGLNPHAGNAGLFGTEEAHVIAPAITTAAERFPLALIAGPFPPDGFFAMWRARHSKAFDAVICMYHDQGLIPAKLLDFGNTVNITLGLPIVRTSVDHGVGYDIAGKEMADPASFCAALKMAAAIARRRRRGSQ